MQTAFVVLALCRDNMERTHRFQRELSKPIAKSMSALGMPDKPPNVLLSGSAGRLLSFRDQIDVTHHAGVVPKVRTWVSWKVLSTAVGYMIAVTWRAANKRWRI